MQEDLDCYIIYLRRAQCVPHTIANYGREIGSSWSLRGRTTSEWSAVSPALLRSWLAALHAQGYVKASVARRVSELRAFYAYLQRRDLVEAESGERDLGAEAAAATAPSADRRGDHCAAGGARSGHPAGAARSRDAGDALRRRVAGERVAGAGPERLDLTQGQVRVTGKGDKERIALIGRPAIAALRLYIDDGGASSCWRRIPALPAGVA